MTKSKEIILLFLTKSKEIIRRKMTKSKEIILRTACFARLRGAESRRPEDSYPISRKAAKVTKDCATSPTCGNVKTYGLLHTSTLARPIIWRS